MNKKYLVLFLVLNCFINVLAQKQLDVVHYSTSDGLSNSSVYNIYQDKKGFLWIPTEYGLNKFDGNTFRTYDVSNGFPDNISLSCTDGPSNSLLVGTFSKGVIQIESNGRISRVIDPFKGGQIIKLFYSDSLLYCYSMSNVCVYNYKNGKSKYFESGDTGNFSDSLIDAVALVGNKLLIGNRNGLYFFSDKIKKRIQVNSCIKNISAIYSTNDLIWIGTKGVIYKLSSRDFSIKDSIVFDGKRENMVDCILEDHHQNVWFSTNLPISLYRTTKESRYTKIENVSEILNIGKTDINGLITDRENNIWIGTYNKGFFCIKNSFLNTNTYFKNFYITSVYTDSKKSHYVSCIDGIYVSDTNNVKWSKINADKNNREYTYGYVEHENTVYFLTNGVYPDGFVSSNGNKKIVKVAARTLAFLNDSIALSGGWNNQIEVKRKQNDEFELMASIFLDKLEGKNNRVNDIAIGENGIAWCASDLGIFKIDLLKKQSQKINWDTSSVKIHDIVIDRNNVVWFAAENNLIKFDQKKWQHYSSLNEQKLGVINSLAVDKKNRLYVGTLKGLYIIENGVSNYLDDKSGLSSNEINELFYDSISNKVLIATNDSYSEFDIGQYEKFKNLPLSVDLTSALINDSIIPLSNEFYLDYEKNNIRLNFVAINLTFPRSVRYQYKIDNSSWLNLQSNVLELASLTHGEHVVSIRASLDNRNWCRSEKISITVSTPFYLTFRFWLIIVISFLLISYFAVQFRISLIQKKANERYIIQKQLEELKFKSLNASINPHFIFNSLNSIQNYINHNDKNKASNYLGKFARLIRLVLDKANEKEITIKEEIERLTFYIQLEQDRFDNSFTFVINASKQVYDIIIPNMIIQPLVENSILHGIKNIDNAHIQITFEKIRDVLIITVDDNGVGINSGSKTMLSNHKSMAISNIKERLTLYPNSSLVIIDKRANDPSNKGTLAQIRIQL